MATIIFNGKTYNRLEDMPPEARQAYEQALGMLADKNQNGVPDALEGITNLTQALTHLPGVSSTTRIKINGQVYQGLESLPPEVRQRVEKAMGTLDKDHNGVPDFFENMQSMPFGSVPATPFGTPPAAPMIVSGAAPPPAFSAPPPSFSPAPPLTPMAPMTGNAPDEDAGRRRLLIALVVALLLLIIAGLAAALIYVVLYVIPR